MDKYRKIQKPKGEQSEKSEEEIRLTATGSISAYVSRANTVFNELNKNKVIITATGNALTKAVTAAEVIKRRFKGLHQITKLSSTEIVDEYEPLEEGLEKVTDTRSVPSIEITLSKDALDTKDKGYQAPIDESLVKDYDPEEMAKNRENRERGGGRGKAKGKGKGKGKDEGKGKGKGKGKEEAKGKGKGKGKGKEEPKGKGKGKDDKGKGKGKGKDDKGKGKGKGDSKGKDKGKGKGKSSKGYDSYDRGYGGYDDWGYGSKGKSRGYDDYGYGSKGSSKGKGKGKGKSSYSSW